MKYCHNCGYKSTLGSENFCPGCGQNLTEQRVSITDTKGDVFGVDTSGNNNVMGKGFAYTRQGTAIVININNPSSIDILEILRNIKAVPIQLQQSPLGMETISDKDVKTKLEESINAQQQIKSISEEVDKIEKKEGTRIEEIRAENIQISRNELLLKECILKGNEHLLKKEYSKAYRGMTKSLELDPDDATAWNNKGNALGNLGRHEEAIKCYDKAIEIAPNYAYAWNNKGIFLVNLGRYDESIEYFDKAIELDPNLSMAWNNRGLALDNLGNYEEGIECYDKAIEIILKMILHGLTKVGLLII